ncbi:MAG: hypothetical protein KDB01_23960, partial [Planctomycetaceae bacterium]|nr:hypothetical protein [Planctomycetaceae bacterium]
MPEIIHNFRISTEVHHYYNVSNGVGLGRENDELDVLLVQFFLNNLKLRSGGLLIDPRLTMDGQFGAKTQAAILKFQQVWNSQISVRVPRVAVDSIVSSGRGVSYADGSRTWTILALNALVGNPPNFGPKLYCQLHTHPECPPQLRSFFAQAPQIQVHFPRATNPARPTPQPTPSARATVHGRVHPSLSNRQPLTNQVREISASRRYNRNDPGVQWAAWVLQPGRGQLTAYEYSEIMESMEGTGGYSLHDRTELLLQIIELTTGDGYPRGTTLTDLMEFLRQAAMLGTPARQPQH